MLNDSVLYLSILGTISDVTQIETLNGGNLNGHLNNLKT
jgi:hypothetical protein